MSGRHTATPPLSGSGDLRQPTLTTTAATYREPYQFPWRSARLGWVVAAVVLVGGVPLFLCLPPWNDVTLHDMAARSILRGGVHYRDVFDTNLPGIDWAMALIRAAFGWGYEVLRAFDLLVIGAEVTVLSMWVRRVGGTSASVAWMAVAAALFYPFTSEFSHVQRDPWMALPTIVAAWLRVRHISPGKPGAIWSIAEGFVWGVAVWVKPHVLVPAVAVWVTSALILKRQKRPVGRDLLALVAGGLLAGLPGVAWLVGTGAWPYFIDVFTNWNPDYVADGLATMPGRASLIFTCFRPWSLLHFGAIPLAVAWLWSRRDAARAVLAALYLGFLFQGVVIQKGFDYVHVAETFLGMAVLASAGWCVGFAYLAWFVLVAALLALADAVPAVAPAVQALDPKSPAVKFERHPLLDPSILEVWPRCWHEGSSAALRDKLGAYTDVHCGTTWQDLEKVAAFLQAVEPPLGDRELTCWHDSTHPLCLMLNLEPSTRYMHFGTALDIRKQAPRIAGEVRASPQRYVVSDLRRMTWDKHLPLEPGQGGDPLRLPAWFPKSQRVLFPWNQPVVFRAGRYVVHKMTLPPGVIDIPPWNTLDQLGPGE